MQIKEDCGLPEDSSWLHDHSTLLNEGCCWLGGGVEGGSDYWKGRQGKEEACADLY